MILTNSINGFDGAQELLIKLVEQSPDDWATRKRVVQVLYDEGLYLDASKLIWAAPEVPPVTEEVVFTVRVVAMGQPARAVRLVSTMIETNQDNPEEYLNIAKALLKEGLALQALRFYGVATAKNIELIDKDFEMSLMNADSGDDHWEDLVEVDDFPWEGPRDMSVSDLVDDSTEGEGSAAEMLLNSVTQRVPLKAPVKQTAPVERSNSDAVSSTPLPSSPVREPKPVLPPASEAGAKQQTQESSLQKEAVNEEESHSSLVNFFKHKEMEEGQASAGGDQQDEKSDVPATAETSTSSVSSHVQEQVAPEKPMLKPVADTEPFAEQVQQPSSQDQQPATPVSQSAEATAAIQAKAKEATARVASLSDLAAIEPASRPEGDFNNHQAEVSQVIAKVAQADDTPSKVEEPEKPIEIKEDVSDMVANVLAERHTEQPKANSGGLLGSLKSVFKRSKSTDEPAAQTSPTSLTGSVAASEAQPKQSVSHAVSKPVTAPVARPVTSSVATSIVRKPKTEGHEPPRELDGRTQLVALAPQDGSVFFEQLSAKYSNVDAGQLLPIVTVARDMANVDYLQLITSACSKDLTAFSKLLSLHRVMSDASCGAWVEDMNLLRKGYGDAVLATVVSKYSVAECREILGAVYQRPSAQAAS